MNSTDPTKAVTLSELISEGKNGEISQDTTCYINRIDDLVFPTSSVFDSYMDFIYPLCVMVRLNEDEYYKYKYKPKLLSYDVYGTVELWDVILKLNRVQSSMEFDKRVITIITKDKIDTLTKIMVYNKDRLEKSRQNVGIYL